MISQQDAQGYAFEKLARHGAALSKNMNTQTDKNMLSSGLGATAVARCDSYGHSSGTPLLFGPILLDPSAP